MTAVNTGYGAAGSLLSEAQILGNRGLSYGGQDTLALGIGAYDAYVLDFATPAAESPTTIATKALILKDDSVGTKLGKGQFLFKAETSGAASGHRIEPPSVGGPADPTLHGAVLTVYNTAGTTTDAVSYHLPASGWVVLEKGGFAFAGERIRSGNRSRV